MAMKVMLTNDAATDLKDLYHYIKQHDIDGNAAYVLDQIEKAFNSLSDSPARGSYPQELIALGIREYREIFFKPYRIIYRIAGETIYIMLIVDGRRDIEALLHRRLLEK